METKIKLMFVDDKEKFLKSTTTRLSSILVTLRVKFSCDTLWFGTIDLGKLT